MPNWCLVLGCTSRGNDKGVNFYRVPSSYDCRKNESDLRTIRRNRWITALNRDGLTASKLTNGRICSKHFVSGKPASLDEQDDPDWVPSLSMNLAFNILSNRAAKEKYGCDYKGGFSCVVRGCPNRSAQKSRVFFSFPKDSERSKTWLLACNRADLLEKVDTSKIKSYRLCDTHFENRMFTNNLKNRLLPTAIPTMVSSKIERSYVPVDHVPEKRRVLGKSPIATDHTYCCDTTLKVHDFPEICRSCLQECGPNNIFKVTYKDFCFCDIFETCTSVRVVEGDGLPENICASCMSQFIKFYEFAQKCQESNTLLKEVLNEAGERSQNTDEEKNVFDGANEEIEIKIEDDHRTEMADEVANFETLLVPMKIEVVDDEMRSERVSKEGAVEKIKIRSEESESDCVTCKMQFPSNYKLLKHCRVTGHEKPRNYECEICKKSFTQSYALKGHIRAHTKEGIHTCPVCGARFKLEGNFNRHLKIHTGKDWYVCKICGKGFIRNDNYLMHLKAHSGERPFLCSYCGKDFTSMANHVSHERLHEAKKVVCQVQNKRKRLKKFL